MLSTWADSQSLVSIFGFYLAHRVQVNVKTTTSGEQPRTHLLNARENTPFPEVFAFCISTDLENPPGPCFFCSSPWLSLGSPPLCSHLLRANTVWGNHAPSGGCGPWSPVTQQGVQVHFSGLPSPVGRSSALRAGRLLLCLHLRDGPRFLSPAEALPWVCLSSDWAPPGGLDYLHLFGSLRQQTLWDREQ